MLEIFALVVLIVIISVAIWLVVIIGNLPGKLARQANHPQAEAITLLGWIGLLTAGIGWFVALVWARMRPISPDAALLEARVVDLERKLARMEDAA